MRLNLLLKQPRKHNGEEMGYVRGESTFVFKFRRTRSHKIAIVQATHLWVTH